jgi:hypothetical protein
MHSPYFGASPERDWFLTGQFSNGGEHAGTSPVQCPRACNLVHDAWLCHACAVIDPLAGVLRDGWHLYRIRAARMLAVAAALYGPAIALTALVTINHGPALWCDLADGLATFLLITEVAAHPPAPRSGNVPTRIRLSTAVVRAAPAAAVLAGLWLATVGSISILRFWDFLVAIPALYLMFMWMLAVPVAIIEELPVLAALRRSWRLIHGHGSAVLWMLTKAYVISILVLLIPIIVTGMPGMPVVLHRVIPVLAAGVGFAPFAAIALTLTYCRLAAARSAAESGPDARPEPAPAA